MFNPAGKPSFKITPVAVVKRSRDTVIVSVLELPADGVVEPKTLVSARLLVVDEVVGVTVNDFDTVFALVAVAVAVLVVVPVLLVRNLISR